LIAEDETIIRLDLRELLQHAGFEVCGEARDGEEAVQLALATRPDLALLDVKMPRLDGIEAARRILDELPIPVLILTAYTDEALVRRAVEAGVFGYLAKPFREQDVLPAIWTTLGRHADLAAAQRRGGGDGRFDVFIPSSAGPGAWPLTVGRGPDGSVDVSLRQHPR